MREQGSQTETETAPVMSSSRQHRRGDDRDSAAGILSPQRAGLAPPEVTSGMFWCSLLVHRGKKEDKKPKGSQSFPWQILSFSHSYLNSSNR